MMMVGLFTAGLAALWSAIGDFGDAAVAGIICAAIFVGQVLW
jgi:hypothetical protein